MRMEGFVRMEGCEGDGTRCMCNHCICPHTHTHTHTQFYLFNDILVYGSIIIDKKKVRYERVEVGGTN